MKSIFDTATRDEIISRISLLNGQSKGLWGRMTVAQMVKHCAECEKYYYGNMSVKRSFLGRLIGKTAISSILKNEAATLKRNAPTARQFKVSETGLEFEAERENWKQLIKAYETLEVDSFTHWFFGKMTKAQLGQFVYKHCDHHLRQFGV